MGDDAVRRLEDERGGAVVLLEAVELRLRVVAAKLLQILHALAAEAVHGLIVITDDKR